jgi:hypothetical protein
VKARVAHEDASVTREQALVVERLRRGCQEFLDLWYPGTAVTVDCTGEAYLVQVMRGMKLAPPIWIPTGRPKTLDEKIALRREVLSAAWLLATAPGDPG